MRMWSCTACCCVIALISAKRGDTFQLWLVFSFHICSMMLLSLRIIIFVKPRLSAWITASLIAVAWASLGHLRVVLQHPTKMFFPSLFLPIKAIPYHFVLCLDPPAVRIIICQLVSMCHLEYLGLGALLLEMGGGC